MRTLGAALVICGSLCAQEPVFKKGVFKDAFWGITYTAPGLRKRLAFGDETLLFKGKCDGGVTVTVRVHESTDKRSGAAWRKLLREQWTGQGRVLVEPGEGAEPQPWILYAEKSLAGYLRHHGHAFAARGFHCFEVHAAVREKGAASEGALRAALGGIALAPEADGTLLVFRLAHRAGKPRDHPLVLLEAGQEYLSGRAFRIVHPELAVRVLRRARSRMRPGSYTPEQLWSLYETGGSALLASPDRDAERAAEWLARAEEAAGKLEENAAERARQSAYNLACACSLAGKTDEAFAALYRAYDGGKPVDDGYLSGDKDLENLRRDERWHKFWADKVKG